MNCDVALVDEITVLSCRGRGDNDALPYFKEVAEELVDDVAVTRVVIDLGEVDYLCSAFLGVILLFHRQIKEKGGNLRVARLTPFVKSLFELTNLDSILAAQDTLEHAIRELAEAP